MDPKTDKAFLQFMVRVLTPVELDQADYAEAHYLEYMWAIYLEYMWAIWNRR